MAVEPERTVHAIVSSRKVRIPELPDVPADAWRWHGVMLMKQGKMAEGRTALQRYLAMAPSAPDAPFVRQMIQG